MPGYKLIIKNSKVILKSAANYIINLFGIKDNNTGTGNVTNGFIDWKIQHFTDTAANFTTENPTLLVGQLGIETDALTTAPKFKIGDGVTAWNSLPYSASGGGGSQTLAQVLANGALTNEIDIKSNDGDSKLGINNGDVRIEYSPASMGAFFNGLRITLTQIWYNFTDTVGSAYGWLKISATKADLTHSDLIDFTAPSVKKNNVEIATVNDIPSISGLAPIASPTFTGTVTTPSLNISGLNASQLMATDASKNAQSLDTATYPSLTELTYVKGITSALQTQLNSKLTATNNLSDLNNAITARTTNLKMYDMFMTNADQTTTSNVASNITDLVSPTLTASKRYKISGVIHIGCNNTGGVKIQITVPTGATLWIDAVGQGGSRTGYLSNTITASATLVTTAFCTSNTTNGEILINGEVSLSSTSGTIQFGFASGTNTQTSTIYQLGTQLTLTQIN